MNISQKDMTYGDYLSLDVLLSSQNPRSDHHDEMCFILVHQAKELWMKLILHELQAAIEFVKKESFQQAFKALARVSQIQRQLVYTWDILSTLTPTDYTQFRGALGKSSGFQSYQYRLLEFYIGAKNKDFLEMYPVDSKEYARLSDVMEQPSLYDLAVQKLARSGFTIHTDCLIRDWSLPYIAHDSVEEAWKEVYENTDRYWDLYQLAEKMVDIEDGLQQWRFRHMKTVERIIGFKKGTGGSSGVMYLKKVLEQRFFPELWDVRTRL